MAILNVKVRMEVIYSRAEYRWTTSDENLEHIKAGDVFDIVSVENWDNCPEKITVNSIMANLITFDSEPDPELPDGEEQLPDAKIYIEKTYPLKDPQTMQWDSADVEAEGSSGTNQLGKYFRDVVDQKITVGASWGPLEDKEIAELLSVIKEDTFLLEYPDAYTGEKRTMEAYVNSRTAPMYRYQEQQGETPEKWMWQGLSINFMEV